MIDSGTTHSYFPEARYRKFLKFFTDFCSNRRSSCGGINEVTEETTFEYEKSKYSSIEAFFSSFPVLEFWFGDSGSYKWNPVDYLIQKTNPYDSSALAYGLGILEGPSNMEATLGNSFMRNHEFYFNKEDLMLEITKADCS